MSTNIKLKHSAQAGKEPVAGNLVSGELAINTADEKIYMLNSSNEVVQIAGPGSRDGEYVKLVGDDTAQTIVGAGGLKTEGPLKSDGGFIVNGGNADTIEAGITYNQNNKRLFLAAYDNKILAASINSFAVQGIRERLDNRVYGLSVTPTYQNSDKLYNVHSQINAESEFSPTEVFNYWAGNQSSTMSGTGHYGYFADSSLNSKGDLNCGFYSNLTLVQGEQNYNFYANSNAPSFFKGSLICGQNTNAGETDNGTTIGSSTFSVRMKTNVQSQNCIALFRTKSDDTDSTTKFIVFAGAAGEVGSIRHDNNGGVILENTSDYRVQENVIDLPSAVDTIKSLRPVNFNYTWAPGKTRSGFIANELQSVEPAAVIGIKDETEAIGTLADYDGTIIKTEVAEPSAEELTYTEDVTNTEGVTTQNIRTRTWAQTGTRPVYQGVDQTKLIPLLTKALQEALERIEVLEAGHTAAHGH